jgi:hypothetical protein
MGVEDAGTVALLIKHLCMTPEGELDYKHFESAMRIYQEIRIPRTGKILDISKKLGSLQDERATNEDAAEARELFIQGEVMMNGTLPELCPGATHNYKDDVMSAILEEFCKRRDKSDVDNLIEQGEALFDELEEEDDLVVKLYKEEEIMAQFKDRTLDPKEAEAMYELLLGRHNPPPCM